MNAKLWRFYRKGRAMKGTSLGRNYESVTRHLVMYTFPNMEMFLLLVAWIIFIMKWTNIFKNPISS